MKLWKEVPFDADLARALAGQIDLPLPVVSVLVGRGIATVDAIERFIKPRLSDLSDPGLLPGMDAAVARVWRAIEGGETIAAYGDYDADGVTSTALLTTVLKRLNANVIPFLPHRMDEGYGLSPEGLERCLGTCKPTLMVTVDCGTSSGATVEAARQAGVDVVVTDHHEVSGTVAEAVAVVNPHLGGPEELRSLAGVGVAFKFCHALLKHGRGLGGAASADLDLRHYLDLVAVGTVADVVPLTGENRILVRHGLQRLNKTDHVGLRALIAVAGIEQEVDAHHLGFVIGPRLNAVGRLASATSALELLLTADARRADELARELDSANRERRQIEDEIRREAEEEIEGYFNARKTFGLVAGREDWHIGTVGIVASRLCAKYRRPAVVIGFDEEGHGRGSCRSIEDLDLVEVLRGCSEFLTTFGGHKMAAGLGIEKANLGAFCEKFNALCAERLQGRDLRAVQPIEAWIGLGEVDERLFKAVQQLQPLGLGNPTPTFGARGVQVVGQPRVVGQKHLKMQVASGGTQLDAIAFGMGDAKLPEGGLDLLFQVQQNTYKGRTSMQLNVKDFRAASSA